MVSLKGTRTEVFGNYCLFRHSWVQIFTLRSATVIEELIEMETPIEAKNIGRLPASGRNAGTPSYASDSPP